MLKDNRWHIRLNGDSAQEISLNIFTKLQANKQQSFYKKLIP